MKTKKRQVNRSTKSKVEKMPTESKIKKKNFRTYNDALKYLMSRTDYETQRRYRYNVTTFDLSRMKKLLKNLGDPHKNIRSVHISGTKGKGSTSTMLSRMLEANGYKVGLYTSPHVTSLHERIEINSEAITKDELRHLINRIYVPVERMAMEDDSPTFFELMTAIAFMHFLDKGVDLAVLETGMGGRLDSTNVVKPDLVGITSISYDHQLQLGSTLAEIASEKAGIIKKGVPVVTVPQHSDAMDVIRVKAAENKSPLCVTGEDVDFSCRFESSREFGPHTRICITTPTSKFEHLRVPLPGEHQATNCGLALSMLDQLKNIGYEIDDEKAVEGLNNVKMPGRMEIVYNDPKILVDTAHNAASIKALIQAIGQHVPYDSMVVIFGCNCDKDIEGMLLQLQYGADKVIFTRSSSPKAVSPDDLAEKYTELTGKMCQTAISLGQALKIAGSAVGREDLICITGSFYLVGQAKERFSKKHTA